MTNKPHGTMLICEPLPTGTYAFVSPLRSREVPAGYFIEVWVRRGRPERVLVGNEVGYFLDHATGNALTHGSISEALSWCRQFAYRREAA